MISRIKNIVHLYYVDQTDNRVVKYQTRGLRNIETGGNIEKNRDP